MEFQRLTPESAVFFICAILSLSATAVAAPADEQFILQQQRQQALEAQLTPQTPDIRLQRIRPRA